MNAPNISVIICTRNRAKSLSATLAAFEHMQQPSAYEVLVIDNASTDTTRSVVEDAAHRVPVRYLYEARRGASAARNTGFVQAQGQLIFILDDDCIAAPDWLYEGTRLLKDKPLQLIGGWVGLHDPRDLPLTIRLGEKQEQLTKVADLFGFIHGCNLIFGRAVLDKIGDFDTLLGPGTSTCAGDDTDFIYRGFKAGIPVHFAPTLRVAHAHGRRLPADEASLMRGYVTANGALAFKHLLRGQTDLARVLYWSMLPGRGHSWARKRYLAHGALAYLSARL
jgi:glycosyltransferase involved in cell wall biosynthesis